MNPFMKTLGNLIKDISLILYDLEKAYDSVPRKLLW
jgi:hypothetical protein